MKKKRQIILAIIIIISTILGAVSLYTPKGKGIDVEGFSSERAKKHIKEIAKEPHSIQDKEALKDVREYILAQLKELGLSPEVFTYEGVEDRNGDIQTINNIYAKMDGKDGEDGSYILLASHYDSSPKKRSGEDNDSHGAADAGYGVSTILEVLRNVKESGKPLENGIKILITDGEEMGLLGAKQEMAQNLNEYKNVSFVVNLEARGIKGPALMFETSANNKKVVDLYKKANLPVSYSLAADVYRKMPNGTDFTEFINKGFNGVNFAVLNNLDYYHTSDDNYENISDSSIQHYGEQLLPMVQEFIYSDKYSDLNYFNSKEDAVFFNLLPNVFITYSGTVATVLAIIAVILLGIVTKISTIKVIKVLKSLGFWILGAIGTIASGLVISYLISLVTGVKFSLTYMPRIKGADLITMILILALIIIVSLIFNKVAKSKEQKEEIIFGGAWFNALLLVIFMFVLPGGSYLFLWSLLLTIIGIGLSIFIPSEKGRYAFILPIMLIIIMYVPVIINIYIALTIGALGVVLLLALIPLSIIVPVSGYLLEK